MSTYINQKAMKIAQKYPPGTKVILNHMDDIQAPPPGTRGTVTSVDDMGQIHVNWESGGSLALIPGVDSFKVVKEKKVDYTP